MLLDTSVFVREAHISMLSSFLIFNGFLSVGVGAAVLWDNTKAKEPSKKRSKISKVCMIVGIILLALGIFATTYLTIPMSSSNGGASKWDDLSPAEQEWYERNYGGGKADAYDQAIEDYAN